MLYIFFFFSNAGGGGERVLWTAIRDIQQKYPHVVSVVYTGDTDVSKEDILERVRTRFNIELDPSLVGFKFLKKRSWVEGANWPRFTLIGQSIGSIVLGWEALKCLVPDIWIGKWRQWHELALTLWLYIEAGRRGTCSKHPFVFLRWHMK
jgi:alpha-1,2-mannosyltransferase